MWLIVRKTDGAVVGVNYNKPNLSLLNQNTVEIKEWLGEEPPPHDPEMGIESYDPTLDCPDYEETAQAKLDCEDLYSRIQNELDWLNITIPSMNHTVARLAKQNRASLKALRYIIKKLEGERQMP